MILAPVIPVDGRTSASPVTVRLIGVLDRVLIESFADACAGLTAPGARTLIVRVGDLVLTRDENLTRFLAILSAYEAAGHRILVDGSAAWRRIAGSRGARFSSSDALQGRTTRRQIIIAHSIDRRAGAA